MGGRSSPGRGAMPCSAALSHTDRPRQKGRGPGDKCPKKLALFSAGLTVRARHVRHLFQSHCCHCQAWHWDLEDSWLVFGQLLRTFFAAYQGTEYLPTYSVPRYVVICCTQVGR